MSVKWPAYFVGLGVGIYVCHRCMVKSTGLYSQYWPFFGKRRHFLPLPVSSPQLNNDAKEAKNKCGFDEVDENQDTGEEKCGQVDVDDVCLEAKELLLGDDEEKKDKKVIEPEDLIRNDDDDVQSLEEDECKKENETAASIDQTFPKSSCSLAFTNVTNLESSHEISHLIDNLVGNKSLSPNNSAFAGETVAKLNQLIHQVQDIRESVGEINADMVNVRRGTRGGHCLESDISLFSFSSDIDSPLKQVFNDDTKNTTCSPSLEWDSNGLKLDAVSDSSSIDESTTSINLIEESSASSFRLTSDDSGNSSNTPSDDFSLDESQEIDQSIMSKKFEASSFITANNSFSFSSQNFPSLH